MFTNIEVRIPAWNTKYMDLVTAIPTYVPSVSSQATKVAVEATLNAA